MVRMLVQVVLVAVAMVVLMPQLQVRELLTKDTLVELVYSILVGTMVVVQVVVELVQLAATEQLLQLPSVAMVVMVLHLLSQELQ